LKFTIDGEIIVKVSYEEVIEKKENNSGESSELSN